MSDIRRVSWRKSSRSGAQSDCVEVAVGAPAIRDSKNPSAVLGFTNLAAVEVLVSHVSVDR